MSDLAPQRAEFQIFTGALSVLTKDLGDGTQKKVLRGTASSSIKDHHGDEFTPGAIAKMADSAKRSGMTIFLNHKYSVPEDVFGSTLDAAYMTRQEGMDAFADMDLEIGINEANPRALATVDALENGTRLGISVGCIVKEWHPRDAKDRFGMDGMIIDDAELLEASIVGIPANPRSWVQGAVKALRKSLAATDEDLIKAVDGEVHYVSNIDALDDEGELTEAVWDSAYVSALPSSAFACPKERKYPHHDKSGKVDLPHLRAALSRVGDKSNDQCGAAHLHAHAKSLGIGEEKDMEPDLIAADTCPTCGGSKGNPKGGCKNSYHNSAQNGQDPLDDDTDPVTSEANPDTQKSSADPEDGVTDDHFNAESTDDQQPTEQGEAGAEEETKGATPEQPGADPSLERSMAADLTQTFTATLERMTALKTERDQLVEERNQLTKDLAEAREGLRIASAIVEKIATLPLGRKTRLVQAANELQGKLSTVYEADFLKFLDERNPSSER